MGGRLGRCWIGLWRKLVDLPFIIPTEVKEFGVTIVPDSFTLVGMTKTTRMKK